MTTPITAGPLDWLRKPLTEMSVVEAAAFLDAVEYQMREIGARNSRSDSSLIQQIHNLTHELGATCEYPEEEDDGPADEDLA